MNFLVSGSNNEKITIILLNLISKLYNALHRMIKTNYELTNNIFICQCWGMWWRNHFYHYFARTTHRKWKEKKINKPRRMETMSINCVAFKTNTENSNIKQKWGISTQKKIRSEFILSYPFYVFHLHLVTLVCLKFCFGFVCWSSTISLPFLFEVFVCKINGQYEK